MFHHLVLLVKANLNRTIFRDYLAPGHTPATKLNQGPNSRLQIASSETNDVSHFLSVSQPSANALFQKLRPALPLLQPYESLSLEALANIVETGHGREPTSTIVPPYEEDT